MTKRALFPLLLASCCQVGWLSAQDQNIRPPYHFQLAANGVSEAPVRDPFGGVWETPAAKAAESARKQIPIEQQSQLPPQRNQPPLRQAILQNNPLHSTRLHEAPVTTPTARQHQRLPRQEQPVLQNHPLDQSALLQNRKPFVHEQAPPIWQRQSLARAQPHEDRVQAVVEEPAVVEQQVQPSAARRHPGRKTIFSLLRSRRKTETPDTPVAPEIVAEPVVPAETHLVETQPSETPLTETESVVVAPTERNHLVPNVSLQEPIANTIQPIEETLHQHFPAQPAMPQMSLVEWFRQKTARRPAPPRFATQGPAVARQQTRTNDVRILPASVADHDSYFTVDPTESDLGAPSLDEPMDAPMMDGVGGNNVGDETFYEGEYYGDEFLSDGWGYGGAGCSWLARLLTPSPDAGVGRDWLANAPFEIESAQPMNHTRLRLDSMYDQAFPDRSEFFWARSPGGRGPLGAGVGERSVDYQDFRVLMETGGEKFSVGTEIPIRAVDPELNQNTAGLGDIALTTKTVLFDGKSWQLTQVFKSYFNTGSPSGGLGTGHISLEPGVLLRHEWSKCTHLHAEVKYLFPLGGDPTHSGEVIRYGFGMSKVWHDGDSFAVIPTLEFVGWIVASGQQTLPNGVVTANADGIGILNVHPGVRFVFDSPGDWGMWDMGLSAGLAVTNDRWYDSMGRFDVRFRY